MNNRHPRRFDGFRHCRLKSTLYTNKTGMRGSLGIGHGLILAEIPKLRTKQGVSLRNCVTQWDTQTLAKGLEIGHNPIRCSSLELSRRRSCALTFTYSYESIERSLGNSSAVDPSCTTYRTEKCTPGQYFR